MMNTNMMVWTFKGSLLLLLVACASARAAPAFQITAEVNGDQVDWNVFFAPDSGLLAAGSGSMAVEFSLESTHPMSGDPQIAPQWMEEIDGVLIDNPGNNPYAGSITEGVRLHSNVASLLGFDHNIDAVFASLGSTIFEAGGPKLALSFATPYTTEPTTVAFSGFIAQDPDGDFVEFGGELIGPSITSHLFGDANNDGVVNGFDLLSISDNFGIEYPMIPPPYMPGPGDANGDGVVNGFDLLAVSDNFGNTRIGSAAALAAIPEPATAYLSLLVLGVLYASRSARGVKNPSMLHR